MHINTDDIDMRSRRRRAAFEPADVQLLLSIAAAHAARGGRRAVVVHVCLGVCAVALRCGAWAAERVLPDLAGACGAGGEGGGEGGVRAEVLLELLAAFADEIECKSISVAPQRRAAVLSHLRAPGGGMSFALSLLHSLLAGGALQQPQHAQRALGAFTAWLNVGSSGATWHSDVATHGALPLALACLRCGSGGDAAAAAAQAVSAAAAAFCGSAAAAAALLPAAAAAASQALAAAAQGTDTGEAAAAVRALAACAVAFAPLICSAQRSDAATSTSTTSTLEGPHNGLQPSVVDPGLAAAWDAAVSVLTAALAHASAAVACEALECWGSLGARAGSVEGTEAEVDVFLRAVGVVLSRPGLTLENRLQRMTLPQWQCERVILYAEYLRAHARSTASSLERRRSLACAPPPPPQPSACAYGHDDPDTGDAAALADQLADVLETVVTPSPCLKARFIASLVQHLVERSVCAAARIAAHGGEAAAAAAEAIDVAAVLSDLAQLLRLPPTVLLNGGDAYTYIKEAVAPAAEARRCCSSAQAQQLLLLAQCEVMRAAAAAAAAAAQQSGNLCNLRTGVSAVPQTPVSVQMPHNRAYTHTHCCGEAPPSSCCSRKSHTQHAAFTRGASQRDPGSSSSLCWPPSPSTPPQNECYAADCTSSRAMPPPTHVLIARLHKLTCDPHVCYAPDCTSSHAIPPHSPPHPKKQLNFGTPQSGGGATASAVTLLSAAADACVAAHAQRAHECALRSLAAAAPDLRTVLGCVPADQRQWLHAKAVGLHLQYDKKATNLHRIVLCRISPRTQVGDAAFASAVAAAATCATANPHFQLDSAQDGCLGARVLALVLFGLRGGYASTMLDALVACALGVYVRFGSAAAGSWLERAAAAVMGSHDRAAAAAQAVRAQLAAALADGDKRAFKAALKAYCGGKRKGEGFLNPS
ncbi:hypothetical protein JKP88DRAFT_310588 [Tribonema minus]|uniref:Uncharacterized protein n=1 Tax=Tribonema minus TaxID=303371 RepID=A0A835Z5E4_9STRA|nr:hypothetical protein JKP88DRAFT_310588 [Tribonema minus]